MMCALIRHALQVVGSNTNKPLHIIAMEEQFETLPQIIRRLGPWAGSYADEVTSLKPAYRALLAEQRFVVVYAHVSKFSAELLQGR